MRTECEIISVEMGKSGDVVDSADADDSTARIVPCTSDSAGGKEEHGESIKNSVYADLIGALDDTKVVGPVLAALAGMLMYYFSLLHYTPLRTTHTSAPQVRPLLTEHEVHSLKHRLQYSETALHTDSVTVISFRHHQHTGTDGNFQLPELFYNGVLFGVLEHTNFEYAYMKGNAFQPSTSSLLSQLEALAYKPTSILPRQTLHYDSGFNDTGYGLYYSYKDLADYGILSSDLYEPWKRVLVHVKEFATKLHVPYVLVWHCRYFGRKKGDPISERIEDNAQTSEEGSPGRRKDEWLSGADRELASVVQTVVPVRTGYGALRSSHVVWLSAVNGQAPARPALVYRKAWTIDDHWSHYSDE